jgi:Mn2+/Fe2+ NRAMP family transporter
MGKFVIRRKLAMFGWVTVALMTASTCLTLVDLLAPGP